MLKFDPGNVEATTQKIGYLQQHTKELEEKLKTLNDSDKQLKEQLNNGQISTDQYNAFRREVEFTENSINKNNKEVQNLQGNLSDIDGKKPAGEIKEIGDELDKSGEKSNTFGDMLKANLTSQAIIGAVKGLVNGIKEIGAELVGVAAEVRAEQAQFEAAFGDMAGSAKEAFAGVAESTGVLQERLEIIGTKAFSQFKGAGLDAASAMDEAAKFTEAAADAAAYYDISIEEASDKLRSFSRGNTQAGDSIGLFTSEAQRNEKAMDEYGKKYKNLTEAQKQMLMLDIASNIYEVNGAMGQASREADGYENVMGNLNEMIRQVKAVLGEPLLDFITPIIMNITQGLQDIKPYIEGFASGLSSMFQGDFGIEEFQLGFDQAKETLMDFASNGSDFILKFSESFRDGASETDETFIDMAISIIETLVMAIGENLPILIEAGGNFVIGLVEGLVSKISLIGEKAPELISVLSTGISGALPEIAESAVNVVMEFANNLISNVKLIADKAPEIISKFVNTLRENFPAIMETAKGVITTLANGIVSFLGLLIKEGPKIVNSIVSGAKTVLPEIVAFAGEIVGNIIGAIIGKLIELVNMGKEMLGNIIEGLSSGELDIIDIGKNIVKGVWEGILSLGSWIIDNVKGFFGNILQGAKDSLGIKSPSRAFRDEVGKMVAYGTALGINDGTPEAVKAVKDMTDEMKAKAEEEAKAFEKFGSSISKALENSYTDQYNSLNESADNKLKLIKEKEYEELEMMSDSSIQKMQIYSDEYYEKIKYIDESTGLAIEGIGKEIDAELDKLSITNAELAFQIQAKRDKVSAIDEEVAKEKKAIQEKREAEKFAELEKAVSEAENVERQIEAQKRLDEFTQEQVRKKKEETQKAEKDLLNSEIQQLRAMQQEEIEIAKKTIEEKKALQEESLTGLDNSINLDKNTYKEELEAFKKDIPRITAELLHSGADSQDQIVGLLESYYPDWQDAGKGFMDYYLEGFNNEVPDMIDNMEEVGEFSVQGYINGLLNKEGDIIKVAKRMAELVSSIIASSLEIESPSKVMMKLGEHTGEGFSTGMENTIPLVESASRKLGLTPISIDGKNGGSANNSNVSNSSNIILNIENFINNRKEDIETLTQEIEFYRLSKSIGKGEV